MNCFLGKRQESVKNETKQKTKQKNSFGSWKMSPCKLNFFTQLLDSKIDTDFFTWIWPKSYGAIISNIQKCGLYNSIKI